MLTIAKFGGSSLATAERFRAAAELIRRDPARKGIVVSAPGKRAPEDFKITDALYDCYAKRQQGGNWQSAFALIERRFSEIADGLKLKLDLSPLYAGLSENTLSRDAVASRGEYYSARLLSALLGYTFLDAAEWLAFREDGSVDTDASYARLRLLADAPFVTPGFYGVTQGGAIRTLPRGGSDVTGALCAAALHADLYENWTDVAGIYTADPHREKEAKPIARLSYDALAALAAEGLQVLHEGAVAPVREQGIPIRIASSFEPEKEGTWIGV